MDQQEQLQLPDQPSIAVAADGPRLVRAGFISQTGERLEISLE